MRKPMTDEQKAAWRELSEAEIAAEEASVELRRAERVAGIAWSRVAGAKLRLKEVLRSPGYVAEHG